MIAFFLSALLAIDPVHSKATFSVKHIFVETVTGTVPVLRGSIEIPDGATVPAHVNAELDATRLRTDDEDRDAALQSPDWFDTKLFPTWSFVSEKITPTPSGFAMVGLLTIHGVTKEEVVMVVALASRYRGTCKVNRRDFGMKVTRLDAAIGETVDITLDIALK